MSEPQQKRPFTKVTFEEVIYTRNTALLEHMLLLAVVKSYRFYVRMKRRLCPTLADNRTFRPDFTRPDFNYIYSFVAQFWEALAPAGISNDRGISADLIDLIFAKKVEQNLIAPGDAHAILAWLKEDINTIDIDPDIIKSFPENEMVSKWLEERACDYEQRRVSRESLGHAPTAEDWQQSIREIKKAGQPDAPLIVNTKDFLFNKTTYRPAVPIGLEAVNEMIGGGCRLRDTTIVGAISGGGKTVLAMQFALDFILDDWKTLVLTTEQPPSDLVYRMISNHMSIEFGVINSRLDQAQRKSKTRVSNVVLDYLPTGCTDTTEHWDAFNKMAYAAEQNLRFLDWSNGGKSLVKDFDNDIAESDQSGWTPDVIIVDWIGGGLDQNEANRDGLRHFYKAAGETIIAHGKRTNRAMIGFAQLNKTLVKAGINYVTMDMLSECKSLVDNAATFLGITARRDEKMQDAGSKTRFHPHQFICADKARWGPGGKAKVHMQFKYQRFANLPPTYCGGDP